MIKLGPTGQFPQDNPDEIKERERAAARRDCRQASLLDPELDGPAQERRHRAVGRRSSQRRQCAPELQSRLQSTHAFLKDPDP